MNGLFLNPGYSSQKKLIVVLDPNIQVVRLFFLNYKSRIINDRIEDFER